MSGITNVVLAGATGNLGPAILEQLLDAGFKVTVFTRKGSKHDFPSSVTVAPVDYDSVDSLTTSLTGQDAVVSTLAAVARQGQLNLVQAAAKAGVKRFIPSEFGSNTGNEKAAALPVFKDKIAVQDALKNQASASGLTYSLIITGPFLDWGLKVPFLLNLKGKSVTLYDGGERVFSTTTLANIGQAVAGVLKHPEETKNRFVYVQSTATSLKQLAAFSKKATGADGWNESVVPVEEVYQKAWAELKKEKPDPNVFIYGFLHSACFGEGYGSHFDKTDNELLGIKELNESELQELVNSLAK